jgi:hypothetical protein
MNKCIVAALMVMALGLSQSAWAVDESSIWLPKRYSDIKPKLLAAAREAEKTERCIKVVAGEMIVGKNTEAYFYFVITCRDKDLKTYNLSYHYPVVGDTPEIVAEQRPQNSRQPETIDVPVSGIDKDQVLGLCEEGLLAATDSLDGTAILANLIEEAQELNSAYHLRLPFTALSELGNEMRYHADCVVSQDGKVSIDLVLESAGALVICRDDLRAESILLGQSQVVEEEIRELPAAEGRFQFQIPFDINIGADKSIRYSADCQLSAEGDTEIVMTLQPMGALTLCKAELLRETSLMKPVEIEDQPLSESVSDGLFLMQLNFSANDPDRNKRQFIAHCQVNQEAEVDLRVEINRDAILPVCITDLYQETKNMLDVVVLEQDIPALQEENEGYVAIIPFNAKNPSGSLLRYQAECRVDGSGRSTIELQARKY